MATELDQTLDRIMDVLTAEGQPFETVMMERRGQQMPAFKNAPPSLAHYFAHYCHEHGDATFLVDGDVRLSFAESYTAARAVAAGLISRHGLQRGDRIGIAARNSANWIIAYMGIVMAGGCATLLNGFWNGDELAYGIRLAECKYVLADRQRAERLAGTDHAATILPLVHNCPPQEGLAALLAEGEGETADLPELGPDDLATILYTSGSTGLSKGAWSDHRSVVAGTMSYAAQTLMAFTYLDGKGDAPTIQPCALVAVPLFHVTGEVPLFLQSFALGRKLVILKRWDALEALRLMEAEKVTYFVGVPLMSYEIATHPDRAKFDISACASFAAGGAPRPPDHVSKIKDSFPEGFPLIGYGLTETNAVGCANFNENYMAKPTSTGRASRPIVELAMMDEAGNQLPQGETGEICIRSVANFNGYWNNDEATAAAYTADAFFRTGDLGYVDEDGYLFIVDRKKDIIIRGGENISCIEVEQAFYAREEIAECSVFGLPHERYGEIPAAVYFVKPGANLSEETLVDHLKASLAPFKVPTVLWRSEEALPRLGTQKIDKRSLREHYVKVTAGA